MVFANQRVTRSNNGPGQMSEIGTCRSATAFQRVGGISAKAFRLLVPLRPFFCGILSVIVAISASAAERPQVDLCNVDGLIETTIGLDGPLTGCNAGDIAHFQINTGRVSYSTIVARYCDLTASVVIEPHPDPKNQLTHVVCRYHWKWAKQVTPQKHPDSK